MDKSRKTMLADLFYEDYNDDWIDGVTRELLEYPLSYEKGRGDYFFFVGLAIINKSSIHCRYLIKQELVKRYRPERKLVDEMFHIATLDREILDPGEKMVLQSRVEKLREMGKLSCETYQNFDKFYK